MTNNKLTDDELNSLAAEIFDAAGFYFQSGRRPGVRKLAGMLTKAAHAVSELQEHRKADKQALMYGIVDANGIPYTGEGAVSLIHAIISDAVSDLNEMQCEHGGDFRVINLYAAPQPLTDAERAELQERRKIEGVYHLATLYEIDGVFTRDPCALANARGRNVQGYVEIETANMFYKEYRG
ncbi:hypothetical protein ETB55_04320 [Salmonella enterica subsp. enterica serovar Omuna]|nr:hypothetical protein [Salmonella enterica subsp. enterica serovar Omuna]